MGGSWVPPPPHDPPPEPSRTRGTASGEVLTVASERLRKVSHTVTDVTGQVKRRFLEGIEWRRLGPLLDGSQVLVVRTPLGERRALMHRHWSGLIFRIVGAVLGLVPAIWWSPPSFALIVICGAHAVLVSSRRGLETRWGLIVGGLEFAVGAGLGLWLGEGWLRVALILYVLAMIVLTVIGWQVDMEFITRGKRVVRTRGMFLLKRTVEAPLVSVRIAEITGPFLGLGFVTIDTTSERDHQFHYFGIVRRPNEWAALILREAKIAAEGSRDNE